MSLGMPGGSFLIEEELSRMATTLAIPSSAQSSIATPGGLDIPSSTLSPGYGELTPVEIVVLNHATLLEDVLLRSPQGTLRLLISPDHPVPVSVIPSMHPQNPISPAPHVIFEAREQQRSRNLHIVWPELSDDLRSSRNSVSLDSEPPLLDREWDFSDDHTSESGGSVTGTASEDEDVQTASTKRNVPAEEGSRFRPANSEAVPLGLAPASSVDGGNSDRRTDETDYPFAARLGSSQSLDEFTKCRKDADPFDNPPVSTTVSIADATTSAPSADRQSSPVSPRPVENNSSSLYDTDNGSAEEADEADPMLAPSDSIEGTSSPTLSIVHESESAPLHITMALSRTGHNGGNSLSIIPPTEAFLTTRSVDGDCLNGSINTTSSDGEDLSHALLSLAPTSLVEQPTSSKCPDLGNSGNPDVAPAAYQDLLSPSASASSGSEDSDEEDAAVEEPLMTPPLPGEVDPVSHADHEDIEGSMILRPPIDPLVSETATSKDFDSKDVDQYELEYLDESPTSPSPLLDVEVLSLPAGFGLLEWAAVMFREPSPPPNVFLAAFRPMSESSKKTSPSDRHDIVDVSLQDSPTNSDGSQAIPSGGAVEETKSETERSNAVSEDKAMGGMVDEGAEALQPSSVSSGCFDLSETTEAGGDGLEDDEAAAVVGDVGNGALSYSSAPALSPVQQKEFGDLQVEATASADENEAWSQSSASSHGTSEGESPCGSPSTPLDAESHAVEEATVAMTDEDEEPSHPSPPPNESSDNLLSPVLPELDFHSSLADEVLSSPEFLRLDLSESIHDGTAETGHGRPFTASTIEDRSMLWAPQATSRYANGQRGSRPRARTFSEGARATPSQLNNVGSDQDEKDLGELLKLAHLQSQSFAEMLSSAPGFQRGSSSSHHVSDTGNGNLDRRSHVFSSPGTERNVLWSPRETRYMPGEDPRRARNSTRREAKGKGRAREGDVDHVEQQVQADIDLLQAKCKRLELEVAKERAKVAELERRNEPSRAEHRLPFFYPFGFHMGSRHFEDEIM